MAITDMLLTGIFETHIFIAKEDDFQKFEQICSKHGMKALDIFLHINRTEYISVYQSSKRFRAESLEEAVQVLHADSKIFRDAGFNVLRDKLELEVDETATGLPMTNSDMESLGFKKYFEVHMKIGDKDNGVLTRDQMEELEKEALKLSKEHEMYISLSYNAAKEGQRFFNFRSFKHGVEGVADLISKIEKSVNRIEGIQVKKSIYEFGPYDTNTPLDNGWLPMNLEQQEYHEQNPPVVA
jgi:hypothetical protein